MRNITKFITTVALASLCLGGTGQAQKASSNAELQQRLNGFAILTKVTADQTDIVTPGSILALNKDGLMMCAIAATVPLSNTYKGGAVSYGFGAKMKWSLAEAVAQSGLDVNTVPQRKFVAGEKVWVVGTNLQDDGIVLRLYSDPYDNVRYHGDLKIQFGKATPSTDEAMKMLADMVTSDSVAQVAPPALAPLTPIAPVQSPAALTDLAPPPPPDASSATPKTVALGQTKSEVVAILGQPQKIADVGTKEIDYYGDMKVILVNGKVTDIQ